MISKKLPQLQNDVDLDGKCILLRVDFNVPCNGTKIADDFRILKTLPLIRNLRERGAGLILLSHLTERKNHRSFKPIKAALERVCKMPLIFARTFQEAARHRFRENSAAIMLFENLRAFPGEEKNDRAFAKRLASLGDLYINEDFSQSHRPYASIVTLPKLLPSFAGPLFIRETKKLGEAFYPSHPFLFILGGVKFKTKGGALGRFLKKADTVFLGGEIANTFLYARGYEIGKSGVAKEEVHSVRRKFLSSHKLLLPEDVRIQTKAVKKVSALGKNDQIRDIGPETIKNLEDQVKKARMVLWNGPLGFVEEGFHVGTARLIRALARSSAKVIVGGGDTVAVVRRLGFENKFYHVSTGGGAMLEFLARSTLPGIDALIPLETKSLTGLTKK